MFVKSKNDLVPGKSYTGSITTLKDSISETEFNPRVNNLIIQLSSDQFSVMDYAQDTAMSAASNYSSILKSAPASTLEEFNQPLSKLILLCASTKTRLTSNDNFLDGWKRIPIISSLFNKTSEIKTRAKLYFNTIDDQINDTVKVIDAKSQNLKISISMLDSLYKQNDTDYTTLGEYILAGEVAIRQMQTDLDEAMRLADKSDQMLISKLQDRQSLISALDRRLMDLRSVRLICTNTSALIRSQQETGKMLLEKFNTSKIILLPLWRKLCVQQIIALEQKQAIEVVNALDEATDNLLLSSSTTINNNVIAAHQALNRGAIKIETLDTITNQLVESLQQQQQLIEDASKNRQTNTIKIGEMQAKIQDQTLKFVKSGTNKQLN